MPISLVTHQLHYPMQVSMCNQSRVNPDSYHITRSLSDNHDRVFSLGNITFRITPRVSYTHVLVINMIVCLLWVIELFRSHRGSLTSMFQAFHLRGLTVPFLLSTTHIIYISFYVLNRETFIGRCPKYKLTTHSSTMMTDDHTHAHTPMSCDDNASMQCNCICHCIICHVLCIMITTRTS